MFVLNLHFGTNAEFETEKPQCSEALTFAKLKSENVWYFCLKTCWNDQLKIKAVAESIYQ